MDRSPGFGSTACNYNALFRLGFPAAPHLEMLNLAAYDNSPARSTKSTPSPSSGALTVCKRTVSGSVSLPSRGAFHLSLTVLVHYRSPGVFSLGAWSPQLHTRFPVPRTTPDKPSLQLLFAYGAVTLCGYSFRKYSAKKSFGCHELQLMSVFHYPDPATLAGLAQGRFGLFPVRSPLLRESRLISFPRDT
jgi:hypothetical protein